MKVSLASGFSESSSKDEMSWQPFQPIIISRVHRTYSALPTHYNHSNPTLSQYSVSHAFLQIHTFVLCHYRGLLSTPTLRSSAPLHYIFLRPQRLSTPFVTPSVALLPPPRAFSALFTTKILLLRVYMPFSRPIHSRGFASLLQN